MRLDLIRSKGCLLRPGPAVVGAITALVVMGAGVEPGDAADSLDLRWEALPFDDGGTLDFLPPNFGAVNTVRGIAYSTTTGNVLVASRTFGSEVHILAGADADQVGILDTFDVSGGIFPLNMIAVADDGVIYACNLDLHGPGFRIYRWENEADTTPSTIAWEGNPDVAEVRDERWGDSIAVRGSGVNTQILVPTRAIPANDGLVAIFTTTDGENFTPTLFTGAANEGGTLGCAFGPGDTIYTKSTNLPLVHTAFDLTTGIATQLNTYTTLPNRAIPIGVDVATNRLAAVVTQAGAPELLQLYDISDAGAGPIFQDEIAFTSNNENLNAVGAVAFGVDVVFALSANNSILALDIEAATEIDPPGFEGQPISQAVIEGGGVTFDVSVTGDPPFTFQWSKDGGEIEGATTGSYTIDAVTSDDAGDYTVTVTNAAGSATSDPATLTVLPRVDTDFAEIAWSLAPGDRSYLTDANTERGVAINPTNGNVLVVSRAGTPQVQVLNGDTGEALHQLDLDGVGAPGAIFPINMIGVADDGAVYAGNLSLDGSQFAIYRWASDAPTEFAEIVFDAAFDGAPIEAQRIGDTIAVRGSGLATQVLCSTRSTNQVVVFTTTDGIVFTANAVTVADVGGNFGLGVAFGAGDTFWGKAQGGSLYHCSFDLGTGTGAIDHEFTTADFASSVGPVGVDPENNLLVGVSNENPDNVQFYDISDLDNPPVLLDQEFFATDNANTNGTGSVAFGDGVVVALGTNNGILSLSVAGDPGGGGPFSLGDVQLVNGGTQVQFTLTGQEGESYLVEFSGTLADGVWSDLQTVTLDGTTNQTFTLPVTVPARYYRATEAP